MICIVTYTKCQSTLGICLNSSSLTSRDKHNVFRCYKSLVSKLHYTTMSLYRNCLQVLYTLLHGVGSALNITRKWLLLISLPTLHNRRLQDICILMYKVKHNLCPRTVCNIFKTSNHSYSLRQTDFYLPNFNTLTYGKHSLRYLSPKLWSKLSSSERSSTSLYNFKLQIRKRDFNNILEGCNSCHLCNS